MDIKPRSTTHTLYVGDSRAMSALSNESIHLIVTSPPYWQIKDYGTENQIGFNDSYSSYINNLNLVWNECNRVLHNGCRLCVNIGDQFCRAAYYGRYKVIPIRTEIIRFCEAIGLDYMGAVIWQKVTTCNTSGGATIMGSFPHPRNGILKIDYEFILIFKKPGKAPKPSFLDKELSAMSTDEWNEYFSGHWNFSGVKQTRHTAAFPEELPSRLIRMFSFRNEIVLDPFAGSATTLVAAAKLGRNSIGYEISPVHAQGAAERFSGDTRALPGECKFSLELCADIGGELSCDHLPYIFSDSVRISRSVDPRKKTYGSVITGIEIKHSLPTVVRVNLDCSIALSDSREFFLKGISISDTDMPLAREYLEAGIIGKKVIILEDARQHNGKSLAMVYLKNRTCINNRMVRDGLAQPMQANTNDASSDA